MAMPQECVVLTVYALVCVPAPLSASCSTDDHWCELAAVIVKYMQVGAVSQCQAAFTSCLLTGNSPWTSRELLGCSSAASSSPACMTQLHYICAGARA